MTIFADDVIIWSHVGKSHGGKWLHQLEFLPKCQEMILSLIWHKYEVITGILRKIIVIFPFNI